MELGMQRGVFSRVYERELASRVDQKVLRWFGHMECIARRVLMAEVSGG